MTPERYQHLMNLSDLNDVERGELKAFIDQQATALSEAEDTIACFRKTHKEIVDQQAAEIERLNDQLGATTDILSLEIEKNELQEQEIARLREESHRSMTAVNRQIAVIQSQRATIAEARRERRVIRLAYERKDLIRDDSGYMIYWPTRNVGSLAAHELRWLADEIDAQNKDWDEQVRRELSKLKGQRNDQTE